MILIWLIALLLAGGLGAWLLSRWNVLWAKIFALGVLVVDMLIALYLAFIHGGVLQFTGDHPWLERVHYPWISNMGISFNLALDGLSLVLIMLTLLLGVLSVLVSWQEIRERVGFFYFNLLWVLAGIVGVFLAMDLFLFYFFWEVMLIPMYFLIGIWGHENRYYAALKFFIFTQAGGLLMLLAIVGLYIIHGQQTGDYTFSYSALLATDLSTVAGLWLMGGFLFGLLVKLPVVPLHSWLPDAHTEAPTAGSVILAGLLLKTGAYGLLRFVVPFFPQAVQLFAPYAMGLGVIGILYGAKLAYAQSDLKRLVAYSSVSHMGFVVLGVFALNEWAVQGVIMQMITHGISTGALFIIAGIIQERIHTRNIYSMGGLWQSIPTMGGFALVFAMASLGLPGLGNFVAEFLILIGTYQEYVLWTVIAAIGLVAASVYSLRLFQKVFHGTENIHEPLKDCTPREVVILGALVLVIVWLGLYPQSVLNTTGSMVKSTIERTAVKGEKKEIVSLEDSNLIIDKY